MLFASLLTALTLHAMAASSSPSAPTRCRELRLGGAIALSGKYASNGKACINGWTLWAERVNARGGLRLAGNVVCNVSLPFDIRDDASSKTQSANILKDMLNPNSSTFAGLDFVIGPFSSGITKGNAVVAKDAGRILFSHGASESLYNTGNPNIFSALTPGGLYMASGLEILFASGARTVVFAHEEKAFSKSVCQGGNKTAHNLGMQVLGYFAYPPGTQSFAGIVYEIKKLRADVYVGCGHIGDITYLVGSATVLNVNPSALLVTHAADTRIVTNIGIQNSHGLMSPTQWDKHLSFADEDGFFGSAQNFNDLYLQRWGSEPSYASAYAAAMGYSLQKAIESASSYETDAVRRALLTLDVNSFYGPLKFSSPDDPSGLVGTMPSRNMVTTQVFNGSIEVVAPTNAASAELLYPLPTWGERSVLLHPCPLGYFDAGTDANNKAICHPCPRGEYRDQFIANCVKCPLGQIAGEPGADSCKPCPAGTHAEKQLGAVACLTCQSGSWCPEGSSEPVPCPAGKFCLRGALLPSLCPDGTYRDEEGGTNISACMQCHPGKFSDKAGTVKCLECPAGRHTPHGGQRVCSACPVSSYQERQGQTSCTACPPTFVTHFSGADAASDCICRRSFFLNRATVSCSPCPVGVMCPGGAEIPYVEEGYYAQLKGDTNRSAGDPDAFSGFLVWPCRHPAETLCPGRSLPNPTAEGNDLIYGVRLPGECPSTYHGISCAWCDDGYFFNGSKCLDCGGYKLHPTNIAICVAFALVALAVYKFAGQVVPKNFLGKVLLANSAGLALFFVQVLSLLWESVDVDIGSSSFSEDEGVSMVSRAAMLDIPFWQPACMFSNTFATLYGMRVALPMLIMVVFSSNWLISVALHILSGGRIPRMSFDHSVNVCGLVLQALYISLCKVGLSYFRCRSFADAPDMLSEPAFAAVVCHADEHQRALPLGIFAMLFTFGLFSVMLYCCIVAPERYLKNIGFRCRIRFLVQKWRPDKWYWGMVYMLRNVAITMVTLVVPQQDTVLQISLILMVLTLCMISLALNRPWRDNRSNYADFAATLMLCCICSVCFVFSRKHDGVSSTSGAWVERGIKMLCGLAGSILLLTLGYALWLLTSHERIGELHQAKIETIAADMIYLGKKISSIEGERLVESFERFTQVDFADVEKALRLFMNRRTQEKMPLQSRKSLPLRKSSAFWARYERLSIGADMPAVLVKARENSMSKVSVATVGLSLQNSCGLGGSSDNTSFANNGLQLSNGGRADLGENLTSQQMAQLDLPRLLDQQAFTTDKIEETKAVPPCRGDRDPRPTETLWVEMNSKTSATSVMPTCLGVGDVSGETTI